MRTPSPATCIASVALAVALTGTATAAGLIDGRSIRDHSIPASKLITHSLTDKQIKSHALTKLALDPNAVQIINNVNAPAGPQGDPGAAGKPGASGVVVFDPSKLVVVNGTDVTVDVGTRVDAQAQCPAGTYVVGGGYSEMQNGGNILVVASSSQPLSNVAASYQGWNVVARNMGGANQTQGWHAIAYCAPAA